MRESFVLAAVLATSSLATPTVAAQLPSTRRVDLQVADSVTRLPIAGARVTSSASVSASAVSDSAGRSGYAKLVVATRSAQLSLVSKSAQKECVVPIVVDGQLREGSFQVDLLDPKELHGVEIYVGIGTIPPEFSSMRENAWCGLIAIWTKGR